MTNKQYIAGLAIESNNSHPQYVSVGHAVLFGAIVKESSGKHFQYSELFDFKGGINNKTLWTYSFNPSMNEHSHGVSLINNSTDKIRIERIVMNSANIKYDFDEFIAFDITSSNFILNFIGLGNQKSIIQSNSDNYNYDLVRENCIKFAVTEFRRITGLSFVHSTSMFGNTFYLPNTLLESLRDYNKQLEHKTEFEALIPHLCDDDLNKFIHGEDDWDQKFAKL